MKMGSTTDHVPIRFRRNVIISWEVSMKLGSKTAPVSDPAPIRRPKSINISWEVFRKQASGLDSCTPLVATK